MITDRDLATDTGRPSAKRKRIATLAKEHEVQHVNYLTATGVDSGLLLNFGASVQVKRKFREYKPKVPFLDSILQNPVNPVDERSES